ncbi:MAG: methylenetetrahydrofolate reductase [Deltaproteobacteria bacterium]|nr:methylenetetrahydrofolate reductase [Deltaproteobacteria bacterium]
MGLNEKLASGEFIVLAEMNTPKGVDISEMMTNARKVKDRIDGALVPDMDNGVMRMSALGAAALMQREGIDPVINVYGRDRNRMAIQGDLLTAYVLGVQTIIVVKGIEMASGDHVKAKTVDDIDETGIITAAKLLQSGVDMAGFELKGSPRFNIGCTLGPYRDNEGMEKELVLAQEKIKAGASFLITPPVFDLDHFLSFMEKAKGLNIPIIPTVFLLKTVGIARYMATYEPGVFISEQMIRRIRQAADREQECLKIAGETIRAIKEIAQGALIVTLGWEYRLPAILEYAGL